MSLLFIGLPGGGEWIIILFVALLIFGRRLPEVARSMGKSINEFKHGLNEVKDNIQSNIQDEEKKEENHQEENQQL
jgi:sec-independent protein translocase protein TatA